MTKLGTSQNGWPVYDNTDRFTRVTVEGVGFWAANRDVAVVLADFTQRYNDTIESITLPVKESPGYDDWSYAVRPVRGQTSGYSNHASATAWDLNSTRHPRGVHGTYSGLKRKGLKALVADYDGVLRDGEFYNQGTIDGMHVEINDDAAAVKAMANKIRERNEDVALSSDDKKWLEEAIVRKVRDLFEDVRFIENRPVRDTDPPAADFTLAGVLAADDRKLDINSERVQGLGTGVAEIKTGQDQLTTKVDTLQATVDDLIAKLDTSPAP